MATKAGVLNVTKKKNGTNLPPGCLRRSPSQVTNIWVENSQKRVRTPTLTSARTHRLHFSIYLNKKTSLSA